jgi:hypothetical protein
MRIFSGETHRANWGQGEDAMPGVEAAKTLNQDSWARNYDPDGTLTAP